MKKFKYFKRVVLMVTSVCIITSLLLTTGCSKSEKNGSNGQNVSQNQGNATGESDGNVSTKPIKLKFYGYGLNAFTNLKGYEEETKNHGDSYKLIAKKFTEKNPNVTVEIEVLNPAGGNTEQLDIEIASGNIPDIYLDNQMRIAKYNGQGLLQDIRSYLSEEEINDFVEGSFNDGPIWRLPIDMSPHFMAINKSIFEQAGALDLIPKPESREWTFDEFLKALKAVHNPPKVYGTILWAANSSGDVCNMGYLWGFGANMFNSGDYSKVLLNSPEGVEALTFMNNLVKEGLTVPGPAALNDDDMLAMWPKQQIAVTGGYSYLEISAKEALEDGTATAPFEPYFVNYPHAPGKPNPPFAVHMHGISVFKSDDADKVKAAVELAKYYLSEEWNPILCMGGGSFSPRKSLASKVEQSAENTEIAKLIDKNGLVDFGATCPQFQEVRNKYFPTLQAVFTNAKTPEQALKDFEDDVNKLLNE